MIRLERYSRTATTLVSLNVRLRILKQPKRQVAQWLSKELQVLGPTYIKIGQFASSRKDIFGDEFADEFASLRDQVIPMTDAELNGQLAPYRSNFKSIDSIPIASASIGQVHCAKLNTGQKVIIKVKRPNVLRQIQEDVQFLLAVFSLMQILKTKNIEDSVSLLNDFEKTISKEVDFKLELENMQKFKKIYDRENKNIKIPAVYTQYSNNDIIVMEYVPSVDILEYRGDRAKKAKELMDVFISQLINTGCIHGDPHRGNMGIIRKTGQIVLYDFGSTIEISYDNRQRMKELIYQLLMMDKPGAIKTLKKLDVAVLDEKLMISYIDLYIEYMKTIDITQLASTHGPDVRLPLRLPEYLFKLIRAYGILEGICKELDPEFNYFSVLSNYAQDIFQDEEFILHKAQTDIKMLFGIDDLPTATVTATENASATATVKAKAKAKANDNAPVTLSIDNNTTQALMITNMLMILINILHH